jgi:hypothetical protein
LVLSLSKDGSRFVDEDEAMGLETHLGLSSAFHASRAWRTSGRSHSAHLKAFF